MESVGLVLMTYRSKSNPKRLSIQHGLAEKKKTMTKSASNRLVICMPLYPDSLNSSRRSVPLASVARSPSPPVPAPRLGPHLIRACAPIPPLLSFVAGPGRGEALGEEEGRRKRDGSETIGSLFLVLLHRPSGREELEGGAGYGGEELGGLRRREAWGRVRLRRRGARGRSCIGVGASGEEVGETASSTPPPQGGMVGVAASGRHNGGRWGRQVNELRG
jgi:hypothetical protein